MTSSHFLYVIRTGETVCKIGITNNITSRIGRLRTDNPSFISVDYVLKCECWYDASRLEAAFHRKYSHLRIQREWFSVDKETIKRDFDFASDVLGITSVQVVSDADILIRQSDKPTNRVSSAVDKAHQWLTDNPDKADMPVRQLADMIGVGKDSVAKARQQITVGRNGHGQED